MSPLFNEPEPKKERKTKKWENARRGQQTRLSSSHCGKKRRRRVPIIRLKLIVQHDTERLRKETLQTLADELGEYFDSEPSGTWVEVEYLPVEQHAENRFELPGDMKTTFMYVLKHHLPTEEEVAREAVDLARIVSKRLQRPRRNTHIFYEPPGKGRIAFGGRLVR